QLAAAIDQADGALLVATLLHLGKAESKGFDTVVGRCRSPMALTVDKRRVHRIGHFGAHRRPAADEFAGDRIALRHDPLPLAIDKTVLSIVMRRFRRNTVEKAP